MSAEVMKIADQVLLVVFTLILSAMAIGMWVALFALVRAVWRGDL